MLIKLFGPDYLKNGLLGVARGMRRKSLSPSGPREVAVLQWRGWSGGKAGLGPGAPDSTSNSAINARMLFKLPSANHTGWDRMPSAPRPCKAACPKGWALSSRRDTPTRSWRNPQFSQLRPRAVPGAERRRRDPIVNWGSKGQCWGSCPIRPNRQG